MNRTDIINAVIEKIGAKSYIEIGVRNPADNFDKIKCGKKLGVDPRAVDRPDMVRLKSDEFYALGGCQSVADVVFIDGDHTREQSARDLGNAMNTARAVVLHDTLPTGEHCGGPVHIGSGPWCGEVWQTVQIAPYRRITFIGDWGVTVMVNRYKKPRKKIVPPWEMTNDDLCDYYGACFTPGEFSVALDGLLSVAKC